LWKINYVAMRRLLQLAALTSNRQIFASTARDRIWQRPDPRLNGFSEAGDHFSVDQACPALEHSTLVGSR
jgi:hypothetical protein